MEKNVELMDKQYTEEDFPYVLFCKEHFCGKKHREMCDKFINIVCLHVNNGECFAQKVIDCINDEKENIKELPFMKGWSKIIQFYYSGIKDFLYYIENNMIDEAYDRFFAWHNTACFR